MATAALTERNDGSLKRCSESNLGCTLEYDVDLAVNFNWIVSMLFCSVNMTYRGARTSQNLVKATAVPSVQVGECSRGNEGLCVLVRVLEPHWLQL